MNFFPLGIQGAWLVSSEVHVDSRGVFKEWFKLRDIPKDVISSYKVAQSNVSINKRGALRGIHYSLAPTGQSKWVSCLSGHIIDVVVDIRPNSPTYKQYEFVNLRGSEANSIFISSGLGHGFISLEDNSVVTYLMDSIYSPEFEYEINPFDSEIGISWPSEESFKGLYLVSKKDVAAPTLLQQQLNGLLPSVS